MEITRDRKLLQISRMTHSDFGRFGEGKQSFTTGNRYNDKNEKK